MGVCTCACMNVHMSVCMCGREHCKEAEVLRRVRGCRKDTGGHLGDRVERGLGPGCLFLFPLPLLTAL